MGTRSARDSNSRESAERIQQWRPGSALDAPEPPLGYKHRWIRESVMEYDDKTNVHKKRQEGWELVRAEEYPDYVGPVIDEGRNAGTIGVGGLVLARIPTELVNQRNQHFAQVASNQWTLLTAIGCGKTTPLCQNWHHNVNLLLASAHGINLKDK